MRSRTDFQAAPHSAFAARMRQIRGDMKQSDFSKLIGVSQQCLGHYEVGRNLPNRANALQISKALRVNLEWLLLGSGEKNIGCAAIKPLNSAPHFRSVSPLADRVIFLDSQDNLTQMTLSEARAWLAANAELVDKAAQAIEAAAEYERQHRPQKPA